ncbi:MAG: S8 family serine peptidase [Planctomycetaceae bacterium]|nr:S8 family serine peptidase [Planctomycetaceae bacterium]
MRRVLGRGIIYAAAGLCGIVASAVGADAPSGAPLQPGALEYAGVFQLCQNEPNLTGHGVQIAVICASQTYINNRPQNDYRINMSHNSLYDANVQFTDGTDGGLGISSHATAIAGVLVGMDESAQMEDGTVFNYRGACPDANVTVHEFWRFVMLHLYGGRGFEADLVTLSLGEMFETWWTRAIEQTAARKDVLVIASVGNGTDVLTPKPLYPAAGANALGVGVADSLIQSDGRIQLRKFGAVTPMHSSMGPTGDLRCKPDIVAPGTALVPSAANSNRYEVVQDWTSLSTPIVCGTAALLLEQAENNPVLGKAMEGARALVLKAVLMNSARKLPYWHKGMPAADDDAETPLDYLQGAGVLDAAAAFGQFTAGPAKPGIVTAAGWDSQLLTKGDWGYEYAFTAGEPNSVITATICWNRVYADVYPFRQIIEENMDLRLELWGVDAGDPGKETLLGYSDSVNDNVEHLYVPCDPNFLNYALRVRLNEASAFTGRQRFAVAWSMGPDRQNNDPLWDDVNGDGTVDPTDGLTYLMLEQNLIEPVDSGTIEQMLKLTPERTALLKQNWSTWRQRLGHYAQGTVEPQLSSAL